MEQNHPIISLYGSPAENEDQQPTKIRVTYTRERDDHRPERSDGDWICRTVSCQHQVVLLLTQLVLFLQLCGQEVVSQMPRAFWYDARFRP